jgi:WD40 repeat protein
MHNVQLASDKEVAFQKIRQNSIEKDKHIMAYSSNSNKLYHLTLTEDKLDVTEFKPTNAEFSWIANIHMHDRKIYFADYHQAKIYYISQDDFYDNRFDRLKVLVDLKERLDFSSLTDFSIENQTLYALDQIKSELYAYNLKYKTIKTNLNLEPLVNQIREFSADASDTNYLIVNSKGRDLISFVDTANYRIIHQIKYEVDDFENIVHSFDINKDYLVTASELTDIAGTSKGSLLFFDTVSKQLKHKYDLDFTPYVVKHIPDRHSVICLGFDNETKISSLIEFDYEIFEVTKKLKLHADFIASKKMFYDKVDGLIYIPSSGDSKIMGVFKAKDFELVKKFEFAETLNNMVFVR